MCYTVVILPIFPFEVRNWANECRLMSPRINFVMHCNISIYTSIKKEALIANATREAVTQKWKVFKSGFSPFMTKSLSEMMRGLILTLQMK